MAGGRTQVVLEFIGDDSRLVKTLHSVESKANSTLGAIGKLGKVGAAASGFMSLANTGMTVVAALGQLAPAALALPGILSGAVVAVQTAKLAFVGMGDAIKGDAEAMAKLAPEAQNVVKAIRSLEGDWTKLQQAVAQEMFKGLAPQIQLVGKELIGLGQENLPLVAQGFNAMGADALKAAQTPFFKGGLQNIMGGTIDALGNMRYTLSNVLLGFVGLGSVGSIYLPAIGKAIDDVARRFRLWVEAGVKDGSLEEMINRALEGFRQLGQLLGGIGSVMATVWGGLQQGLGASASPLSLLVEKVNAFNSALQSPEAQNALRMIGEAIRTISDAFNAVLPYLVQFAATIVSGILPAVITMAGVIRDNGALFAGLILGIVGVVAAVKTLMGIVAVIRGAIAAWTAVQWLLNIAMSANPIGLIILAVAALIAIVALIIANWESVSAFFVAMWEQIKQAFQAAIDWIVGGVTAFVDMIMAQWNQFLAANAALWDAVGNAISTAWDAIVGWVTEKVNAVVDFVTGAWNGFLDMHRTAWENFKTTIMNLVNLAVSWVMDKINGFLDFFRNLDLMESGKALINGFWDGLRSVWDGMVRWFKDQLAWFRGLWPFSPAKWGPFSGTGYVTYSGKALTEDFAGSLAAGMPKVAAAARSVLGAAADPFAGLGSSVGLGQVDSSTWSALLAAGWKGRAGDGEERLYRPAGMPTSTASGGGVQVSFVGNTSDALATVIMQMIRTGKIQIKAA